MKSFRVLFLLAILGAGCQPTKTTAPDAIPPAQTSSVNTNIEWGQNAGGLRSRIWADQQRFTKNEPIADHYAIKNDSDKPLTVWHSGFWPNNRIDVTGPDGHPAKLVAGGEARRSAFSPGGTREKNAPWSLQPGAIDDAFEAYNLRDIYALPAPGKYQVQYVYQEASEDPPVKSNILQIIVE